MRSIFLFAAFLLFSFISAHTQDSAIGEPIQWSIQGKKASSGTNSYQFIFKGKIEKGWRLFSVSMPDDLPNTRVTLDSSTSTYAAIQEIKEDGALQKKQEPLLGSEVNYFENEVEIIVSVLPSKAGDISGELIYMAYKGDEFTNPLVVPFRFGLNAAGLFTPVLDEGLSGSGAELNRSAINLQQPVKACGGTGIEDITAGPSQQDASLFITIFILGFVGGLIALLTPCVFPMIPLTVSFFTNRAASRKQGIRQALTYGFFIFFIYVILSTPFHFINSLNPEILNTVATNVWVNVFFAVFFIIFALSFFGLFEITLPSGFANRVNSKAGIGNTLGIFFLALTLVIVSFSCTGPILGSLLGGLISSNGGAWQLSAGMGGFGLALALPFALFAFFPEWLNSLPKSGSWLKTVKIVLGFVELAVAILYLSKADLVGHWNIIKREVIVLIWVLIGLITAAYLFGIIRFKGEKNPRLSLPRVSFALLFLLAAVYLIPGLTNTRYANLPLTSGLLPPLSYSIYGKDLVQKNGVEAQVVNNYEEALALAKKENKPVLIDFTGWACVNCRKMEENVWTDKKVKDILENKYILVSLFVDDRQGLGDQSFLYTTKDGRKKKIKTVGDKFATLQAENFSNVSQPLYVAIGPDEKLLTRPVGYTPDREEYTQWLQCGLEAYGLRQVVGR